MDSKYFFGFGSLVNSKTHCFDFVGHVTVKDQIREWVTVPDRPYSFLSMVEHLGTDVPGTIMRVPVSLQQDLDAREHGYSARDITGKILGEQPDLVETYQADTQLAEENKPILLSYLDCVIQGYLREFSEIEATGFFETTRNWNRPILNDRNDPIYPRSVELGSVERRLIDGLICDQGLSVIAV